MTYAYCSRENFNPDDITELLQLNHSNSWKIGDKRLVGDSCFDFVVWEYERCNDYDVITENQILNTITDLIPKIPLLKNNFDVSFVLEVVPKLHVNETTPTLGLNRVIIEFCYKTQTDFDIDLFCLDKY